MTLYALMLHNKVQCYIHKVDSFECEVYQMTKDESNRIIFGPVLRIISDCMEKLLFEDEIEIDPECNVYPPYIHKVIGKCIFKRNDSFRSFRFHYNDDEYGLRLNAEGFNHIVFDEMIKLDHRPNIQIYEKPTEIELPFDTDLFLTVLKDQGRLIGTISYAKSFRMFLFSNDAETFVCTQDIMLRQTDGICTNHLVGKKYGDGTIVQLVEDRNGKKWSLVSSKFQYDFYEGDDLFNGDAIAYVNMISGLLKKKSFKYTQDLCYHYRDRICKKEYDDELNHEDIWEKIDDLDCYILEDDKHCKIRIYFKGDECTGFVQVVNMCQQHTCINYRTDDVISFNLLRNFFDEYNYSFKSTCLYLDHDSDENEEIEGIPSDVCLRLNNSPGGICISLADSRNGYHIGTFNFVDPYQSEKSQENSKKPDSYRFIFGKKSRMVLSFEFGLITLRIHNEDAGYEISLETDNDKYLEDQIRHFFNNLEAGAELIFPLKRKYEGCVVNDVDCTFLATNDNTFGLLIKEQDNVTYNIKLHKIFDIKMV